MAKDDAVAVDAKTLGEFEPFSGPRRSIAMTKWLASYGQGLGDHRASYAHADDHDQYIGLEVARERDRDPQRHQAGHFLGHDDITNLPEDTAGSHLMLHGPTHPELSASSLVASSKWRKRNAKHDRRS